MRSHLYFIFSYKMNIVGHFSLLTYKGSFSTSQTKFTYPQLCKLYRFPFSPFLFHFCFMSCRLHGCFTWQSIFEKIRLRSSTQRHTLLPSLILNQTYLTVAQNLFLIICHKFSEFFHICFSWGVQNLFLIFKVVRHNWRLYIGLQHDLLYCVMWISF